MILLCDNQMVASDSTHCDPFDWPKTNQWVCAFNLILFESHHTQDNDVTKNGLIITRMAICQMCQY